MLTKQQLDELASQLPRMSFDIKADSDWKKIANADTFLSDYQLDFSREFKGVKHGFGKVDSCGFSIATHYWIPKKSTATLVPLATLVIVHGYFDHVGIYHHLIKHALEKNLAVLAFDLPGHGLSSGETVVIDSFDQYTQILEEIFSKSQTLLPTPYFAAGQSTGSAILLNYLWRNISANLSSPRLDKIFLCSPLILSRGWRGIELGAIAYEVLKYFLRFVKRGPANSSHDPAFNHFIQNIDPLQSKRISMRWIGAMKEWNERFKSFTPLESNNTKVPSKVAIVQGTDDHTVDWQYNIPLIQTKLPNARVEYIAGAGHQLVNETEILRAQIFDKFDQCFFGN